MSNPVFPRDFELNGCPEVKEARRYRQEFGLEPDQEEDPAYAQCAFRRTSEGFRKCFECENCNHRVYDQSFGGYDKRHPEFYKQIEQYYKELNEHETRETRANLIKGAHT